MTKELLSPPDWQKAQIQKIIIDHVFWAMWIAFLKVPIVQELFLSAVQLKMINELCIQYGVKFSQNRAQALVLSLVSALGTALLVQTSLLRMIPLPSGLTLTVFAGALTYAIGKTFAHHFESGGTFLDLNTKHYRKYFAQWYQEGKDFVRSHY